VVAASGYKAPGSVQRYRWKKQIPHPRKARVQDDNSAEMKHGWTLPSKLRAVLVVEMVDSIVITRLFAEFGFL
jgi:hypothetical protein